MHLDVANLVLGFYVGVETHAVVGERRTDIVLGDDVLNVRHWCIEDYFKQLAAKLLVRHQKIEHGPIAELEFVFLHGLLLKSMEGGGPLYSITTA